MTAMMNTLTMTKVVALCAVQSAQGAPEGERWDFAFEGGPGAGTNMLVVSALAGGTDVQ